MSAKDALEKYYRKEAEKVAGKPMRKKNQTPEADLEKLLKVQMDQLGFSMDKIEAKAVYNYYAGRYVDGQAVPGVSDYFGCCPDGTAAFVEVKAPGRLSTLKPHQRKFLTEKISKGCFGVCVDSCEMFAVLWTEWFKLRPNYPLRAMNYLLAALPIEKQSEKKGLFDGKD